MSLTRVERNAAMGWWWVEVWDDDREQWLSAGRRLGLPEDTFMRKDAAHRLAERINRVVGFFAALAGGGA